MVFNDSALELTPFPGASPTQGHGTVTVCGHGNADFASFPCFLKDFGKPFAGKETICGGLWVPVQEKQGFPMVFFTFPERRPAPPGACAICHGQVVRGVY